MTQAKSARGGQDGGLIARRILSYLVLGIRKEEKA